MCAPPAGGQKMRSKSRFDLSSIGGEKGAKIEIRNGSFVAGLQLWLGENEELARSAY